MGWGGSDRRKDCVREARDPRQTEWTRNVGDGAQDHTTYSGVHAAKVFTVKRTPRPEGDESMDYGKYDRKVELLCPTCGGKEFERSDHRAGDDGAEVVCASCGRKMTSAELQELNGESIDLAVDEMAKDVLDDMAEELRKSLKRATRGSRNLRVR